MRHLIITSPSAGMSSTRISWPISS
jgi:hypothetical protein